MIFFQTFDSTHAHHTYSDVNGNRIKTIDGDHTTTIHNRSLIVVWRLVDNIIYYIMFTRLRPREWSLNYRFTNYAHATQTYRKMSAARDTASAENRSALPEICAR